MTTALSIEARAIPKVDFSYSHPGQSRFRQALIRGIERFSGQPGLRAIYQDWARNPERDANVFGAALRLLRVDWHLRAAPRLSDVPATGGLLLVANHPYGILDGLALGEMGMRLRGNVRILTNSQLCQLPEVQPYLLPVDFSGTPQARKTSAETRRKAAQLLAEGKVVAIFPGGGVATANRPLRGRAVDSEWHPFVGRLATLPGVTTLPLHFEGQNSRLFHLASHLSYALRVALIFHETRRRIGRPLELTPGRPISATELQVLPREDVALWLRRQTMALARTPHGDPDEVFHWPRHIRF